MFNYLEVYDELTNSEKKVLTYIMAHFEEIPFMTINELSAETFVSKTVIINLSQKMGLDGFKEMKYAISLEMKNKRMIKRTESTSPKKKLESTIQKTFSIVNEEDILTSAKLLLKAKNIFIMARGTSKSCGYYLEHLLFSIGIHCFFINDYNHSESFTRLVDEDDVVILLSLSGSTKKILETAKLVHLKHANIISLTSFQANELSEYATLELFCHADQSDTKLDDANSRIGFFILIDLLINTLNNIKK
ncbi:MurR/RpiR family transcriptional regulator [Vagococcus xieshaowenii]|uniref:MurR/RpiR family transcriptional regulator n=1 Tax=Vagococcus xieshaowenii TaxID=2562451 RepID=A0AAJ5EFM7_9ENTE|nr:MurR/RpiR family transcriptional regulator [Vagococcus xieshaowenii]QCA28428.1 MurR/RpiR family transcriptional regulator [Vagococcus xieshaowenii]TFZ42816.1 MurR/RpiR family transcriptional regulator [Vagococcus xieshaowenii]